MTWPAAATRIRQQIHVSGVVQGVGFRPFVYRLATELALAGLVSNGTSGVVIELEGSSASVDGFLRRLRAELPPLARIDALSVCDLALLGEHHFRIASSNAQGEVATGIAPDAATCGDCLRELLDPSDRRYRYPFLNCTNCGPRFTITRRIPYDRPQTSMSVFPMCPDCQREYDDPANRRFHAQPNACPVCGPHLWMVSPEGSTIAADEPVGSVVDALKAGRIVAIKGIGGFHLCVDATQQQAVQRLRERKQRYGKPLAVMVRDLAAVCALCEPSAAELALLATAARPIVLMRRRRNTVIAEAVAPGLPWLGVFLPYAPLHHLLFADARMRALVMTSANLSEEPIAIDNREALERLGAIADLFLLHDREILVRCDDSVAAVVGGVPQLLRRARGFVPLAVDLPLDAEPMLAVGGQLKSAFALSRGRMVYQSQHLGDLENLAGLQFFEQSRSHLAQTFQIEPRAVIHDLHPGYLSTEWARRWAAERGLPLIGVQHHHAHIAACMAEHGVTDPVIGLALDGTGYGSDGTIWGGEVLLTRLDSFVRFAHLAPMPLPGGEKAIREPWRMALGALSAAGFDPLDPTLLALAGGSSEQVRVMLRMIERRLNAPLTSSCGRLFDAVAALVLGRRTADYEAQAAIELEGLAIDQPLALETCYSLPLLSGNASSAATLSIAPLLQAIVRDLEAGVDRARIAAHFHAAVALGFASAAVAAREVSGVGIVALSGGCMANRRLAALLHAALAGHGFRVLGHERVSPGDGGLSYGQLAVAAARAARFK